MSASLLGHTKVKNSIAIKKVTASKKKKKNILADVMDDPTLIITITIYMHIFSLQVRSQSYFLHSIAKVIISSSLKSQQPQRSMCSRGSLLVITDISPVPDTHTQPRKLNIRTFLH